MIVFPFPELIFLTPSTNYSHYSALRPSGLSYTTLNNACLHISMDFPMHLYFTSEVVQVDVIPRTDSQVALAAGDSITLHASVTLTLTSIACAAAQYLCVQVAPGSNANFSDPSPSNNRKCMSLLGRKTCAPGRENDYFYSLCVHVGDRTACIVRPTTEAITNRSNYIGLSTDSALICPKRNRYLFIIGCYTYLNTKCTLREPPMLSCSLSTRHYFNSSQVKFRSIYISRFYCIILH